MRMGRYWRDASVRFLQPRQLTGGVVTLQSASRTPTTEGDAELEAVQTLGLWAEFGTDTTPECVQTLGLFDADARESYSLQAVQTYGLWDSTDSDPTLLTAASGGLF